MHCFVIRGPDVLLLGSSKTDFVHLPHKLAKISEPRFFFRFARIGSGTYKTWHI